MKVVVGGNLAPFNLPQKNTDNLHKVHASHFEHTEVTVNSVCNSDILQSFTQLRNKEILKKKIQSTYWIGL